MLEPQGSSCLSSPALVLLYEPPHPAVYIGARDVSSGLYVCTANTLLTEPSPISCLETLSSTLDRGSAAAEHTIVQTPFITTSGFCTFKFICWLKFICKLQIRIPGVQVATHRHMQNRKFWIAGVCIPLWDLACPGPALSGHICPSWGMFIVLWLLFIIYFFNQLDTR